MIPLATTLTVRLVLSTAVLILGAIALVSYTSIDRLVDGAAWVDHTHRVMLRLEELLSTLEYAESGQRGYLLSGEEGHLARYRAAVQGLPVLTDLVRDMTADNPQQRKSLATLRPLIARRLALLDRWIELKRTGKLNLANISPHLDEGAAIMDQIREVVAKTKTEEERLLEQRSRTFVADRVTAARVIVIGNVFALVFLLCALVALTREIAVRRKAEQDLRQANAFQDSVFDHIPAMVFVKAAKDLTFLRHNKANQELLGYTEAQVLGKNDYDLFPKEQADFFTGKDRVVLSGKVVVDIPEESIQTQHQGLRILHTRKIPVLDADGRPQYLLGISEDITDRKLAETQIRELNEKLEQRASQLEAANKELEGFSYSVSHDLRAPIRAISGFSKLLLQDHGAQLDEEARRKLDVVMSETRRMGALIDDLLAFSRLGRQAMRIEELDMQDLAENSYGRLCLQHQGAEADFQLGILPKAMGDRVLLEQVWTNLLSNALKFTSKRDKPQIEVGTISDPKEHVYFVRDNGAGFDPRFQSKLFGVFERLHDADDFPGTGVGLALVDRIVTRHGGRVWADSKLEEGATFYFTLPKEPMNGNG